MLSVLKKFSLTGIAGSCLLFSLSAFGTTAVDVSVDRVFVPAGFDDNDTVEIVLDGQLPSLCYELLPPTFYLDPTSNVVTVKQGAVKKPIAACLRDREDAPHLKWPVPYSSVLKLGSLREGQYTVVFARKGEPQDTVLTVKKAQGEDVDDTIYAPISSVFIPEMVYETENSVAVLSGVLPTNCMQLHQENIKILHTDHLIEVLPSLTVDLNNDCGYAPVPLTAMVDLGRLKPGRYLLHIRSMTGQSLNKTFTVLPKEKDPRGG
ncbi:MAG: hypothetical protein HYW48_05280 [Deltaproteobacteria bacterium]|nr:hypothetical protein [Deltaproteobacteria bacterium]